MGTTKVYGSTAVDPASGSVLTDQTNGESGIVIAVGAPVYCSAADTIMKALANAVAAATVLGLMQAEVAISGTDGIVQTKGQLTLTTGEWDAVVTGAAGGLVANTIYYLDPANVGKLTVTRPTTTGHVVVEIGVALSTTVMLIKVSDADTKITVLDADLTTAEGAIDTLEAGIVVTIDTTGTTGSPTALAASASRSLIVANNAGAMCGVTLPTAEAGLIYRFQIKNANGLRIKANTDDTIRIDGTVSIATGYIEAAAVGASVTLIAEDAVNWIAQEVIAVWTVQDT